MLKENLNNYKARLEKIQEALQQLDLQIAELNQQRENLVRSGLQLQGAVTVLTELLPQEGEECPAP